MDRKVCLVNNFDSLLKDRTRIMHFNYDNQAKFYHGASILNLVSWLKPYLQTPLIVYTVKNASRDFPIMEYWWIPLPIFFQ